MDRLHDAVRTLTGPATADLFASDDAYLLVVDVPGADPAATNVDTRGDELRISVTREKSVPEDATILQEERPSDIELSLPLPPDVEAEDATATLSGGVLEIELPRGAPRTRVPIEDA